MANDLTLPGRLVLDTAAVVSATNTFVIRKMVLVAVDAEAAASFEDGNGDVITSLAAPAGSSDEIDFNNNTLRVTGLELASISGTGAVAYVYCG